MIQIYNNKYIHSRKVPKYYQVKGMYKFIIIYSSTIVLYNEMTCNQNFELEEA